MELFISWSGDRSGKVAEALRDWLPNVIQSVEPFMSASDIEKGSRWSNEIGVHLENAQFGLICLTQENLEAPWLLFEAGALSKSIESSRVVPYLYGVSQADLQWPLAQFQAAPSTKESTMEVVKSINEASGENGLEQERLVNAFETWWPQLKETLARVPDTTVEATPSRSDRDILEEVLDLSRHISRQGVPGLDLERQTLRILQGLALLTEAVDSTQYLGAGDRGFPNYPLPPEAIRRSRLRDLRRQIAQDMQRLGRKRHSLDDPTSENEAQSSNNTDEEAQS